VLEIILEIIVPQAFTLPCRCERPVPIMIGVPRFARFVSMPNNTALGTPDKYPRIKRRVRTLSGTLTIRRGHDVAPTWDPIKKRAGLVSPRGGRKSPPPSPTSHHPPSH
jgi:hypothetical protein